ncbi:FGGY-family carbohydrate kinase [Rothia sp. ZJ932]|uniref:FGGY-family carbohydrate kinase n=1 Tax=Rothia sp. ZJ932 TaxID=2810516 RepID=UPI0019678341|nr:FGGY family carbohydrate kinase [Rothia sp. ZJ932]QRZ61845.1 sugar kinase [Rothia sp. ZJ932]
MSTPVYFGLDVGTSSTKAVLVDSKGAVIDSQVQEHSITRGKAGLVEMDMNIWWDEFKALYSVLLTRNDVTVKGIGVSGMGPCIAVTDANDVPIAPAALYGIDYRARDEIAELSSLWGQDYLLENYDSQLTTQAGGPKLRWFAQRFPDVFASGARFYMPSSWIIKRITGEYVLDRHSASQCTPLYDPATREWDSHMVEKVAPGTVLPRLGWSHDICGETTTTPEVPELTAGIPVIFGTVDAWAEQESVGAIKNNQLFLMYGTTLFLVANSPDRIHHASMWGTTGTREGTYNIAGGLATSGALTDWFRNISGERDYATLVDAAREVPAGSEGLLTLPYFAGERTPLQDPDARGVMIGLSLRHGRGHIYRSLLEATAFAVRHNIEVMEQAGASIESIAAAGGGVTSDLWPQIVSDVTGRAQELRRESVGASYGDAFMVAQALGAVHSLDEWNPVERIIEPTHVTAYEELYSHYRKLYTVTADIQHQLRAMQP